MLRKTIEAIFVLLQDAYGEQFEITKEPVNTGLNSPGFYILPRESARENGLGDRYEQKQKFEIRYLPKMAGSVVECAEMMEQLYDVLEGITIEDKLVWGSRLHGEIQEGILQFYVNYDLHMLRISYQDNMEEAVIDMRCR